MCHDQIADNSGILIGHTRGLEQHAKGVVRELVLVELDSGRPLLAILPGRLGSCSRSLIGEVPLEGSSRGVLSVGVHVYPLKG